MEKRSNVALLAAGLAAFGAFLGLLGVGLATAGILPPLRGFVTSFGGLALGGLLSVVLGLAGLFTTRAASGAGGRGAAWAGLLGGLVLLAALVFAGRPGAGLPRINDITTDTNDPPVFVAALREPANQGRDMDYPDGFAELVGEFYADLGPVTLALPPGEALARVQQVAESLGWEIVAVDEAAGTLEARETSGLFQFVDDIVVRVRPHGDNASQVDIRSKSRDGQGDLGANAKRIRTFTDALLG